MKKIFYGNKKKVIVISCILIVVFFVSFLFFFYTRTNEKKLQTLLESIGKTYYQEHYYERLSQSAEEKEALLKEFGKVGIYTNLEVLNNYNNRNNNRDVISKFVNTKTNEECNSEKTKIIFYPKEPYGKSDYTTKVILDCGFE